MCSLISQIMLQLTCHRSTTTTPIVQLTSALYGDYVRQHSSDVKLYSELELARRKVLTSLSEYVLTKTLWYKNKNMPDIFLFILHRKWWQETFQTSSEYS